MNGIPKTTKFMPGREFGYSYGPVPSRRLGRSLGINNIPAKACNYSCVYCQLGRTATIHGERCVFYDPEDIFEDIQYRVKQTRDSCETIDFIAFVPDGEPTLDLNLGKEIARLRTLGTPIGVITNSTLLWREDVRKDLARADWVSIKMDTVDGALWRKINRPQKGMELSKLLDGIKTFADSFRGKLVTETMLIKGLNDGSEALRNVADFLYTLQPHRAYLAIPTRPPAENWVQKPDEATLTRAHEIFAGKIRKVEYLIDYEGDDFTAAGNVANELLRITSVHPMRETAVQRFLDSQGSAWAVVEKLLDQGDLIRTRYNGYDFYLRKISKQDGKPHEQS